MRIATMVLAIATLPFIVFEAYRALLLSNLSFGTQRQHFNDIAGFGFLLGIGVLLGAAFAFGVPRLAVVLFLAAGAIGVLGGDNAASATLTMWGVVALILAGMSCLGVRERRLQIEQHLAEVARMSLR